MDEKRSTIWCKIRVNNILKILNKMNQENNNNNRSFQAFLIYISLLLDNILLTVIGK